VVEAWSIAVCQEQNMKVLRDYLYIFWYLIYTRKVPCVATGNKKIIVQCIKVFAG
jgi:hypothetical protein